MTLADLAPWLFGRTAGGIRWGLERTQALLAGVGDPHRRFRSVHVGGTNGKGSVAALCDAALRAASPGRRIGLYTSPHLVSFAERIRIDGKPVEAELLLAAAERLRPAIESSDATFFEATTAIAFLCFAEAGVDVAVVEVGLGGRLDATNVIVPEAAAVTNIAREHTEYLGETLEQIAAEKAGIFKHGVPAVVGETHPAALPVLRDRADAVGAPLTLLDEAGHVTRLDTSLEGTRLHLESRYWGEQVVKIPLLGEHQARNALLAAELLARLPTDIRPGWRDVKAGFEQVRWPGRLQVERLRGTTWLLDVAHNPAGMQALCRALDTLAIPRPLVLVAGILSDKEWQEMLPPLLRRVDAAILTTSPSAPPNRRWDPAEVARQLPSTPAVPIRPIRDLDAALQRASTLAPHGTVLVTGSVHTVGDALQQLEIPVF